MSSLSDFISRLAASVMMAIWRGNKGFCFLTQMCIKAIRDVLV